MIKRNPLEVLTNVRNKIKPQWKLAFYTIFIVGLIAHMMIIINDIPNHDGLDSMYFDQNMITSGRWFLTIACGFTSYFTLPWLIGLLSFVFLGFTAVLLIDLLELENPITVVIISGLLVSFPALTSTFAYIFTADGYMLGLLLATLSVWLTKRSKKGFIAGGFALAFSMGTYQSYLSFCMVLCLYQVLMILLSEVAFIEKVKKSLRYVYMGIIGSAVYMVILQLLLLVQGKELSGYQGIDSLESGVTNSVNILVHVYHDFFAFFFKGNVIYNNWISALAVFAIIITTVIALLKVITKKKLWKSPWLYLTLVATFLAIPLICNSIMLISPDVNYHLIMRYHYILLIILGIGFIERFAGYFKGYMVQWLVIAASLVMIMNYVVLDNIAYSNMAKKFDKTYAYCLRLVDRMEQTEGYYTGIPIAMVGVVNKENYPSTDLSLSETSGMIGTYGDIINYTGKNYNAFMAHYLNVTIENVSDQEMNRIYDTPEYQELDTFPGKNSMKVVDGILYMKTE